MNCVVLMGRLTRDPEIRFSQAGKAVARYSVAVDRRFHREGDPTTDFIDCVAFGNSAEFAEKYFHKGMRVALQGRLQIDQYTAKDGSKRYSASVVIDNQEFAQSKSENVSPALSGLPTPSNNDDDAFLNVPSDLDELPFV